MYVVIGWPVTAAAVLLLSLLTLRLLKRFLGRRLRTWGGRQGADWVRESQALVEDTRFWFCLIVSAYLGSLALTIPEKTGHLLTAVTITALLIQGAIWANRLIAGTIKRQVKQRVATDAASAMTISAVGFLVRMALWTVVGLMMLANFGVDVTALVTGLGIGGVAVALRDLQTCEDRPKPQCRARHRIFRLMSLRAIRSPDRPRVGRLPAIRLVPSTGIAARPFPRPAIGPCRVHGRKCPLALASRRGRRSCPGAIRQAMAARNRRAAGHPQGSVPGVRSR